VVSAVVAEALARGVRQVLGSTYALATTGVAGPDPQEGRAVGTVFVAVAGPTGVHSRQLRLAGNRPEIRRSTCLAALGMLRRTLDESGRVG
jgi:nicotinamide mononucleotide (NMN) deamidase PncC